MISVFHQQMKTVNIQTEIADSDVYKLGPQVVQELQNMTQLVILLLIKIVTL